MDAFDIMMQAYKEGYQGSITDLIMQQQMADQQMAQADVATTQQEAETGLLEGPPRTMVIPGAESITTQGMDYPIDITTVDQNTGMVQDVIPNVQPGQLVNTGRGVDVIETPSLKSGGYIRSNVRDRIQQMRCGGKR